MVRSRDGWVSVGKVEELSRRSLQTVYLRGCPVALSFRDGVFGAIYGVCTHREVLLGGGVLDGEMVRCPSHDLSFHRKTGEGDWSHLPCFSVKEEDGELWLQPRSKAST